LSGKPNTGRAARGVPRGRDKIHAYETHAREIHAYEMHADEVYPHEVHACEMHVYEIYAHKMHTREINAYEIQMMPMVHAYEMHAHGVYPHDMHTREVQRYAYERHPPIGCTLVGCVPVRYVWFSKIVFVVLNAEPRLARISVLTSCRGQADFRYDKID
jgi:hypothetical protein